MHNIYSYHAKFTQEIPRNFIKKYSLVGDTILDPFCGCGTSLLEGIKLKRNVIGIDLSPIGILCSKVKTYKYDKKEIERYAEEVLNIAEEKILLPEFPNRNIWFNEEVLNYLGMLNYNIYNIEKTEYRDLFLLILLSILNNCARKRKTWNLGYLADNVLPNQDRNVDVIKLYKSKIKQLYGRKDFIKNNKNSVRCIESDILKVNDVKNVDLVVTSPPYPFAVDFIRYHRLSLYWIGKSVEELSIQEVGARNKRSRKNAKNDFFYEMENVYKHIMEMVRENGYWCMTIADTTRKQEKINFIEWTIDLFQNNGWKLEKKNSRFLKHQTMAQKRIKTESILIFKKQTK